MGSNMKIMLLEENHMDFEHVREDKPIMNT
jgi:hypothetical protein